MRLYVVVNTSDSDWTTSAGTTNTVNSSDDDGTTSVIVIYGNAAHYEPSPEEIEAIAKAHAAALAEDISFQRESWCIQIIFHLIQHLERIRTYAHRHRRITSRCRGPPDYQRKNPPETAGAGISGGFYFVDNL